MLGKLINNYLIAAVLLITLVSSHADDALQSTQLRINTYLPEITLSIDKNDCAELAEGQIFASNTNLDWYQSSYNGSSCMSFASYHGAIYFSAWYAKQKIASFEAYYSQFHGSFFHQLYANPRFTTSYQFYLNYNTAFNILVPNTIALTLLLDPVSNWMQRINPNKPLNSLFLPGTHDSGSAKINPNSWLTPDADPILGKLYSGDVINLPISDEAKQFIKQHGPAYVREWARTQERDISEQLEQGVRYFDIRLCGNSRIEDIASCHSVSAASLIEIISQLKDFIHDNPSELIILDLNHWYTTDVDSQKMRSTAYNYIQSQLGKSIAARTRFNPESTIGDFIHNGANLIVSSDETLNNPSLWKSVNSTNLDSCNETTDICSIWPNSNNYQELETKLKVILASLEQRKPNYIFVLQNILTPGVNDYIGGVLAQALPMIFNPAPASLRSFSGAYKLRLTDWLNRERTFHNVKGLILEEDYADIDLSGLSLKLNH